MDRATAINRLDEWDRQGRYVFTRADLGKVFHEDSPRTLQAGLDRLVRDEILLRPVKGIYVYRLTRHPSGDTVELLARALRRGHYNYVSLESALSAHGIISQIPVDRLTVMTTGRKGVYPTPYGTIEFTHTRRRPEELMKGMLDIGRALKMANPETAWRDLKRVGRNTHLVNEGDMKQHD